MEHDFEALRATRNKAVLEALEKASAEYGGRFKIWHSNFNPNACYCACGEGGPCEHKWDGPRWRSEDGRAESVTCSRCGGTAMSHDIRNF